MTNNRDIKSHSCGISTDKKDHVRKQHKEKPSRDQRNDAEHMTVSGE